jgi:hypothetical protein
VPTHPADAPPGLDRAGESPVPHLPDNWNALCAQDRQAIAQRRRLACQGTDNTTDDPTASLPRVGLALSGGVDGSAGGSTLYIHIYSESTRMAATALRQALQPEQGAPLLVASIENVVRNAELRQQRPPVPWPNPTLVLHDPASRDCARAIAAAVGASWLSETGSSRVRLRSLPASLQARPGVLELWLPPQESCAAPSRKRRADARSARCACADPGRRPWPPPGPGPRKPHTGHGYAIRVFPIVAKRRAGFKSGRDVQGPRRREKRHGTGFQAEPLQTHGTRLVHDEHQHLSANTLAPAVRRAAHRLEFTMPCIKLLECATTQQLLAIPGTPELDIGLTQSVQVERMFALLRGYRPHVTDMRL